MIETQKRSPLHSDAGNCQQEKHDMDNDSNICETKLY